MVLCNNRPEGFGPQSHLHHSLVTTCFSDVIITPLATWLYLIVFLPLALLWHLQRRKHSTRAIGDETDKTKARGRRSSGWCSKALSILYYLLVLALIAMESLVLARLVAADLGIGLLPFTYVGLLVAAGVHFYAHRRMVEGGLALVAANALWWVVLAAVLAVSVAEVAMEGPGSRSTAFAEKQYPYSDEITDEATMLGVSVVIAALEFACWSVSKKSV